MIEIQKGSEPEELTTYRLKKELNPSYSDMSGIRVSQFIDGGSNERLYDIVINSLAKEQGYICAYCMRRIPQNKVYPRMTIEHIKAQHAISTVESLKYSNMLAVCNGNRNSSKNEYKTCDAKRGSLPSTKQTLSLSPLDPSTLRDIYYLENGEIHSTNKDHEACINDMLNLNCEVVQLPDARKQALYELQLKVRKDNLGRTAPKEYFEKLLNSFKSQERKTPYVGILIFWLEKKIK